VDWCEVRQMSDVVEAFVGAVVWTLGAPAGVTGTVAIKRARLAGEAARRRDTYAPLYFSLFLPDH